MVASTPHDQIPPALARLLDDPTTDLEVPSPFHDRGHTVIWWRGSAEAVRLRHFMPRFLPGFAEGPPFIRVPGTDAWFLSLELPAQGRVEYLIWVLHDGRWDEQVDPRNPSGAAHPFGVNSVAAGPEYRDPDWAHPALRTPSGRITEIRVASRLLGSQRRYKLYLPPGYRRRGRHPVLIVHDGTDYLRYAGLRTVLDNLIASGDLQPLIAVLTDPYTRNREYAADPRHAGHVVEEILPHVLRRHGTSADPASTGIMGASLGAVASLYTAWRYPGRFARLLLQSGSFADRLTDLHHAYPFDPIVEFVGDLGADQPTAGARIYMSCGRYESLLDFNRAMASRLSARGHEVVYEEAWDGHHWQAWRDRLRTGLTFLFPGPGHNAPQ